MPDASRAEVAKVKALRWSAMAGSIGLVSYWGWTFTGLYAWLARAQLAIFGEYLNAVTWLITWVVVLIPLHLAGAWVAERSKLPFDAVPLIFDGSANRFTSFVIRHFFALLGWGFVLGGVVSGGYFLVDASLAGALTPLTVENLYAGNAPASRYVEVTGRPLRSPEYIVGVGSSLAFRLRSPNYYYFPMVPQNWTGDGDVRVVVQSLYEQPMSRESLSQPDHLRGILRRPVPGLPLGSLRQKIRVADAAWLLDETESPEDERQLGLTLLGVLSLFGLLLIGSVRAVAWYGKRRRATSP